jgi:ribosomal subunit interface protein
MIQKFEIQGVHTLVDEDLRDHISKKIGGLDKYISQHSRASAHCEVHLKETKHANGGDRCRCEVTLFLPHQTIIVKESGSTARIAADTATSRLKLQLKKYKDTHENGKMHRRLFARLRGRKQL